jgi:hypothetical protein
VVVDTVQIANLVIVLGQLNPVITLSSLSITLPIGQTEILLLEA